MTGIDAAKQSVLQYLIDSDSITIPKKSMTRALAADIKINDIEEAIYSLLDGFRIDLVLDYPSEESEIFEGRYVWHVKLLSNEERNELEKLSSLQLAVLRILQKKSDDDTIVVLPVSTIDAYLHEQGITDSAEHITIKNRVKCVFSSKWGLSTPCLQIIPENEKSEEYKNAQEEIDRAFTERAMEKEWIAQVNEAIDDICALLKTSSDWLTREQIVTKLPEWQQKFVETAFAFMADDAFIETKSDTDGTQLYRHCPEEDGSG